MFRDRRDPARAPRFGRHPGRQVCNQGPVATQANRPQ
jgi:hypothetical protein